jgi:hypothetical protein
LKAVILESKNDGETDDYDESDTDESTRRSLVSGEIPVASPGETVKPEQQYDIPIIAPTFVNNYVAGGCSLNVIVAIDAPASNDDPHTSQSLHSFK